MRRILYLGGPVLVGVFLFVGSVLNIESTGTSLATLPTPTPTFEPCPTPVPFWVEPVQSPTSKKSQRVQVYFFGSAVTVTAESGTFRGFRVPDREYWYSADVQLLPNVTHRLVVTGWEPVGGGPHCSTYGGYYLSTTVDKNGRPLIIQQRLGVVWLPLLILQTERQGLELLSNPINFCDNCGKEVKPNEAISTSLANAGACMVHVIK